MVRKGKTKTYSSSTALLESEPAKVGWVRDAGV